MTDRTHRNTSIIIIIAALILIWGLALMTADKAQAASVGVINIDIGVNVRSGRLPNHFHDPSENDSQFHL